jgi:hypothetical protein
MIITPENLTRLLVPPVPDCSLPRCDRFTRMARLMGTPRPRFPHAPRTALGLVLTTRTR